MPKQGFAQSASTSTYVYQEITGSAAIGIDAADNKLKLHVINATGALPDSNSQIIIDPTTNSVTIPNLIAPFLPWTEVLGTSQTMVVNNGYIANNVGLVTLTLPTTAAQGSTFWIAGKGAGGWTIAQNNGQTIYFGSATTTTGVAGSLSSTLRRNCVLLVCITANIEFEVLTSIGNITVV